MQVTLCMSFQCSTMAESAKWESRRQRSLAIHHSCLPAIHYTLICTILNIVAYILQWTCHFSAAQWLKVPSGKSGDKGPLRYFTIDYLRNNLRKVVYFWVFWLLNLALYAIGMWNYRDTNWWLMVSRWPFTTINVPIEALKWRPVLRQMRESTLCQTVHVRVASDTQKRQPSDWL